METTKVEPLYYFQNEITDKIIDDYKISYFRIYFNEQTNIREGLRLLCDETIKQLDMLREIDEFDLLIDIEANRFFLYSVFAQKMWNDDFQNYYKTILEWFHSKKRLTFKTEFKRYKEFKNKQNEAITIYYDFNNVKFKNRYMSSSNLVIDYGKYRAEKILKVLKSIQGDNVDKNINYNEVLDLFR